MNDELTPEDIEAIRAHATPDKIKHILTCLEEGTPHLRGAYDAFKRMGTVDDGTSPIVEDLEELLEEAEAATVALKAALEDS